MIKQIGFVLLVTIFLILNSAPSSADMFSDSPSCSKPSKPFQFDSQWEIDNFDEDVQRYKRCISDFVEEKNDAIRNHQLAIDDAIEEWNRFVDYELN